MSAAGRDEAPLIFLIAGEPSGDVLGARLMAALKRQSGGKVRFAGVGGVHMGEEGLDSLFPIGELSVMGLAEVLPHVPRLLRRIRETAARIRALSPSVLVTIDSPDFTFRVAKRTRGGGAPMPAIHYVAPQVWAWRPGKAKATAHLFDRLIALLPFEPPYFEAVGLPCTFVGHPVLESGAGTGDGAAFRRRHGIAEGTPLICVLPGSRRTETRLLLPVFGETLARLTQSCPHLRAVVPTVETVADAVTVAAGEWPVPALVLTGEAEKFDAFAAADVGLAASGSVTLELAMAGVPMVVAYKMNPVTGWLARRLIRTRYVNLMNLVLDRDAVPELLQGDCTPDKLAKALFRLLTDEAAQRAQRAAFTEALEKLGRDGPPPSERAAEVVLEVMRGAGGRAAV